MRAFALLALGATQSIPASAPGAPRWLTDLGESVLARCDLIVLARVEKAAELGGGAAVATLRPERRLDPGPKPGTVVVLGSRGEFRPVGEGGASDLFFLSREGEGGRFKTFGRVASADPSFGGKTRLVEETLRIAALEDPAGRLAQIRILLHRGLAGADAYLRWNALAEFTSWAARHRDRIGEEDLARMREVEKGTDDPVFRAGLVSLLRALEKSPR